MNPQLKKLEQLARALDSYGAVTKEEQLGFMQDVINVLAQFKSATSAINQDTKDTLNLIVKQVNAEHDRILEEVSRETKIGTQELKKEYDTKLKEVNKLIKELSSIEIKNGVDGKDGTDGKDGADGLNGRDGSPDTAEQVRDKLETLKGEERLDASAIKGLEKFIKTTKEIVNGGVRLLSSLVDVNIDTPTNGQVLKYNSTTGQWYNGTGGSGGSITVTVSDTDPVGAANDGDIHLLTDDGTTGGTVIKTFIYDSAWIDMTEPDYEKCKNVTGSTIAKGKIVYVNGANGSLPTITLADNTTETTSSKTIGITAKSITNNNDGYFIRSGLLIGIDTSTFSAGDTLWLGTSGNFTNTRPTSPNHAVFVGYALTSAANGRVLVEIQNGYELGELHDVSVSTVANDDFVQRKSGVWTNRTVAQVKTDLGLSGTNSGDQTSIVGITGTKSQFDTAVTDDNFAYLATAQTFTALQTINNTGNPLRTINSTDSASVVGLRIDGDRATPTNFDEVQVPLYLSNSSGTQTEFVRIRGIADSVTAASETGSLRISVMSSGTLTGAVVLTPTTLRPNANDSSSLGTNSVSWSDLFLAEGGVINWDNGDLTLTQSGNTLTIAGGDFVLGESTSVLLNPSLSADGTWTGTTITGTAGYAQAFGDLVYLDPTDSRWEKTDANSASGADGDARGMIGMVVVAGASDGSACTILLNGTIRADAAFPALTINGGCYVSETAGAITQTAPATTDAVIRNIGTAITADEIYFNPSKTWYTSV